MKHGLLSHLPKEKKALFKAIERVSGATVQEELPHIRTRE